MARKTTRGGDTNGSYMTRTESLALIDAVDRNVDSLKELISSNQTEHRRWLEEKFDNVSNAISSNRALNDTEHGRINLELERNRVEHREHENISRATEGKIQQVSDQVTSLSKNRNKSLRVLGAIATGVGAAIAFILTWVAHLLKIF